AVAIDVRHAFAAQRDGVAGLRAGRDVDIDIAVERGNGNGVAERGLRIGDVGFAVEIVALAMPALVWFDAQQHVEMAGGAAARTGLALAAEAQAHGVFDAGRHRDGELLGAQDQAGATAARAGIFDGGAFAAAGRARRRDHEEALRVHHLTASAAGRAGDRPRAAFGAGAFAFIAAHPALDLDFARHAAHGLFERERQR